MAAKETQETNITRQTAVPLDEPIPRGKNKITEVSVRKPNAGELRGVSLLDLAQINVAALHIVLPRITTPTLNQHEVAALCPADLMALGVEVAAFLVPKSDLA